MKNKYPKTIWLLIVPFIFLVAGCQATIPFAKDRELFSELFNQQAPFQYVSSIAVCEQTNCNSERITSAEILAATSDGMTIIYTDSPRNSIGLYDISDPVNPSSLGRLELEGEPTSVATNGDKALVVIATSTAPDNHSGKLLIVDIASKTVERSFELPGQPDSIAVSPDKNYAVIAIENERSFSIKNGDMPQNPAGEVVIVDMTNSDIANWSTQNIDITGLAAQFPSDPEPEYVDINANNQALVSLQENNHLILIDLATGSIINHFSAGSTTSQIPSVVSGDRFDLRLSAPREPDGVSWLANQYIVTADEGGYFGGTDTVTIFDTTGNEVWSSRDIVLRAVRSIGREELTVKDGAQPENIEVATFTDQTTYLFANIERADIVLVFNASNPIEPQLIQILNTPRGPEGGLAIPSRNLLLVASEDDYPAEGVRSSIHIFQLATN